MPAFKSRRRLVAIAVVVLFWIAAMGHLAYRQWIAPSRLEPRISTTAIRPTDTWMGIYLSGNYRTGFVNVKTRPDSRDGEAGTYILLNVRAGLRILGRETRLVIRGEAWAGADGSLRDLDLALESGEHQLALEGTVADGAFNATLRTGGEEIPLNFPVSREMTLWSSSGASTMRLPSLEIGEEYVLDTLDPLTLSMGEMRIRCVAEEMIEISGERINTKVVELDSGGIKSKAWISRDGEALRIQSALGITLQRITAVEAAELISPTEAVDLLGITAIQPTGVPIHSGLEAMTVRLTGIPDAIELSEDDSQHRLDTRTLAIVSIKPPAKIALKAIVAPDPRDLEGDAFVQADHARIVELAREIAGSSADTWETAQAIYRWVFENIEKEPALSLPSALEVLETRAGDCNEHTVLFAALARAAGIPTRIAIGVVWSGELEGFYYHAWPQVYAGVWIPMDPTLGQPIADATHIKLLEGSIERWIELAPYLGQLEVEVLDAQ